MTSQLELDGQAQSNWPTTHDEDRPTVSRVVPTQEASEHFWSKRLRLNVGVWIRQAEVRRLSLAVGGSCRSAHSVHLFLARQLSKAGFRLAVRARQNASRCAATSNGRRRLTAAPAAHCYSSAFVLNAGWPAHNSIELLIGESCVDAVIR